MSKRNTVVRSLHDVGLAAWLGGSLMGAVGLNGAASAARNPAERLSLSSKGWLSWSPWQTGAIGAHVLGGVGVILGNRNRLAVQSQARSNTAIKAALTLAAIGTTAYSGVLGKKVAEHAHEGAEGATEARDGASRELASAQQQLKVLQWATPALTTALVVLGAQQGEQQRGVAGLADRAG